MAIMDQQESQAFTEAVLEAVGVRVHHVNRDSLRVSIEGTSDTAVVTWEGAATISRETLSKILKEVGH